jgi:cytochrome P450
MEFDPYSRSYFDDPYPTYAWMRDECPVYFSERYGFWALSRFAAVEDAHRDAKGFVNSKGLTIEDLLAPDYVSPGYLNTSDPPEHTWMRRLVSRVFTPSAIAARSPMIRQVIVDRLDSLAGRDSFDFQADFAMKFPADVTSSILGVPREDWRTLRTWCHTVAFREEGDMHSTDAGRAAVASLHSYFRDLAAERRARPTGDLISQLVQATVDDDGRHALDDDRAGSFLTQLEQAGAETTGIAMGNAMVLFARHRSQWDIVRDDPDAIPGAVEETMRYWTPVQFIGRTCTAPKEYDGVVIPEGAAVLLLVASANRDPRQYRDPDVFDVRRKIPVALSLGVGIHACLGAALARTELRIAVEEIASRWPGYEIDESGSVRAQMQSLVGFASLPFAPSTGRALHRAGSREPATGPSGAPEPTRSAAEQS